MGRFVPDTDRSNNGQPEKLTAPLAMPQNQFRMLESYLR
jgi:hypothetical protein